MGSGVFHLPLHRHPRPSRGLPGCFLGHTQDGAGSAGQGGVREGGRGSEGGAAAVGREVQSVTLPSSPKFCVCLKECYSGEVSLFLGYTLRKSVI